MDLGIAGRRAAVAAGTAGRDLDPVLAATRLYVAQRVLSAASEFGQGGDGFEAE